MVYEHLVVVGKVFYSHKQTTADTDCRFTGWADHSVPDMSLLRVSKQIHKEAEDVYLTKNMFVMPDEFIDRLPFSGPESKPGAFPFVDRPLVYSDGWLRLKNLSFGYTACGDYSFKMSSTHWDAMRKKEFRSFTAKTQAQRFEFTHGYVRESQKCDWDYAGDRLVQCCTTLDQLKLDFSNAIYPFSCCRDFDMQFKYLRKLQPKGIRLLGLIYDEEEKVKKLIVDAMTRQGAVALEDLKLEINPKEDPWAKWRFDRTEETKGQA
jgi:hypothetical protein